jgi:nucleoid-associated protein YgaU
MPISSAKDNIQKELLLLNRWSQRGAPGLGRLLPALRGLLASVDFQENEQSNSAMLVSRVGAHRKPPKPTSSLSRLWGLAIVGFLLAAALAWGAARHRIPSKSLRASPPLTSVIAPTVPPAPLMASFLWYKVQPGDTLWRLAAGTLNDGRRWNLLLKLNRQLIKDPHWIYPAQRLRLPVLAPKSP